MTKFSMRKVFLPIKQSPKKSILRFKTGAYLVPFLLVATLFSCKKSADFGLEVQANQDILSANQTDSTSLITYSVYEDSLKTDELSGPNLLGSYADPSFGSLKTSIFTHIRLESSYDFRPSGSTTLDDIEVDSVILYLALDGHYGNLGAQTFEVYQLDDDIYTDTTYYTNSSTSIKTTNLVASGQ